MPADDGIVAFLAARAIPGVEEVTADGAYRRVLPDGSILVVPGAEAEHADVVRRVFAVGPDPAVVRDALGGDPVLGPLLARRPGLRVPGAVDAWELAARAVLGQQVSVAAARRLAARIVERLGEPLPAPAGSLTHRFPAPAAVAAAPDDALPMPRSRQRALRAVAGAGAWDDPEALLALPGIGPWTAGYIALRLGDPDVFLPGDVAVRTALARLGATVADSERWRPLRSAAVIHLWASLAAVYLPQR